MIAKIICLAGDLNIVSDLSFILKSLFA